MAKTPKASKPQSGDPAPLQPMIRRDGTMPDTRKPPCGDNTVGPLTGDGY